MIDTTFTLENKVTMVVGAANGIGRATALAFAAAGAAVACADVEEAGAKTTAAEIEEGGARALPDDRAAVVGSRDQRPHHAQYREPHQCRRPHDDREHHHGHDAALAHEECHGCRTAERREHEKLPGLKAGIRPTPARAGRRRFSRGS